MVRLKQHLDLYDKMNMYRWCSYCQKFLGEREPLSDFSLTHGICQSCKAKQKSSGHELIQQSKRLLKFYNSLKADIIDEKHLDPIAIMTRAEKLGVSPIDLLAGIIQPLLADIAALQAQGQATIVQEHRFSDLVDTLFYEINKKSNRAKRQTSQSDVLLACADGNYHYFGLKLIQLYLQQNSVSTTVLFPSCPFNEILSHADQIGARIIGISVAATSQFNATTTAWAATLPRLKRRIDLIIGGKGATQLNTAPKHLHVYSGDPRDLSFLVRSILTQAKAA